MANHALAPKFEYDLAEFAAELRAKSFSSKLEAARHFNLARPTVSRYESGQIVPPLGYLAELARLSLQQVQMEGLPLEAYRQSLVQEINKALRWHYREKEPFQKPFQHWQALEELAESYLSGRQGEKTAPAEGPAGVTANSPEPVYDWGDATEALPFYGREDELAALKKVVAADRVRLLTLPGIGGAGKTTLATRLAEEARDEFEFVIWRSLRNAPPLDTILESWLQLLDRSGEAAIPDSLEKRFELLLEYLRKRRCLLILDNLESILGEGAAYRSGYEAYGELFSRIGESGHRSCLLLTSREKPADLDFMESRYPAVRSFPVQGLALDAACRILEDYRLTGPEKAFIELARRYGGNPLALKLIAGTIAELFGGEIEAFLSEGPFIFGGVSKLLDQQFERLSALEQRLLYWLAAGREFTGLARLQAAMGATIPRKNLLEALKALHGRSLIERNAGGAAFSLQAVVMEYVTGRLVEQVSRELAEGATRLISEVALLKAQDKDYIREAQARLLLQPILDRLLAVFKSEERLAVHFGQLIKTLQGQPRLEQGYAGGNLVNLLYRLKGDLRGCDLSGLNIWQACLQGVAMQDASLAGSDLSGSVFTEAFNAIITLAYSPDGRLLAAGCADGEVRLWRAQDSRLLVSAQAHSGAVQAVAFNRQGTLLATCGNDHAVKIWEVSGEDKLNCLRVLQGHQEWVWAVTFSPDGQWLATCSSDRLIKIWQVESGECLQSWQGHATSMRTLAFSPDGHYLASGGGDRVVKLWDARLGKGLQTLEGHNGYVQSVVFSPDGRYLVSASEDETLKVWALGPDGVDTRLHRTLSGHREWVWAVAFSPDGSLLASGSGDQTIKLWDIESGECLQSWQGHRGIVRALAFNSEGSTLASAGGDRTLRLWDVANRQSYQTLQGYSSPVRTVAFSPDGQWLASSGSERAIRLWELAKVREAGPQAEPAILNTARVLPGDHELIWSVAFSPDGKLLASASDERTIKLWDTGSGECVRTLHGHSEWVQAVAFSPDGRYLASGGGDRVVKLWDLASGECLRTLSGHQVWIWMVAFSPDGRYLASSSNDRSVKIWEVGSGQNIHTLTQQDWVLAAAFSPDGQRLVTSGGPDYGMMLWEAGSWRSAGLLKGHSRRVWSLAFRPDNRQLASGSEDSLIKLWDLTSGTCTHTLSGHREWIRAVAYSPDGQWLASSSEDGTIRLWNPQDGACRAILRGDRPYERLNLAGATGLTPAQLDSLQALGARLARPVPLR
ncbi:MAG TPA: NB-ARC domain-containing protein [Chloroflexia bacterium]|nr:NB-ARC domain-containing protein [Chloroflexia bacterium]